MNTVEMTIAITVTQRTLFMKKIGEIKMLLWENIFIAAGRLEKVWLKVLL